MSDFSPDMEKNNSSKLNTDTSGTENGRTDSRADGETSAQGQLTGDTIPYEGSAVMAGGESADMEAAAEREQSETEAESGTSPDAAGGISPEASADTSVDTSAGKDSGKPAGTSAGKDSGKSAGKDSGKPAGTSVGKDSGKSAGKDSGEQEPSAGAQDEAKNAARGAAPSAKDDGVSLIGPSASGQARKSKSASYRDKILRHKKRRYRRTVVFVVIIMAVLVAAVVLWMRRGYTRAELIHISQLASDDASAYENLGGNVVQYGSSGAVCVDQRGNTLWSVNYEMQQPITSVSGDVIAIANRSGYYVYVMNTQGLMGTIQTTLPIHSIAAAENGEVAVIMNDTKATWVRLYTAEGKELAYLVRTMEENGYPIAAAVSPDGETLCLSSVSMSNAAVKTNISFYNFGNSGKKVNDYLVQHADFIDEVIPYLHYVDNSTCVCVSDKQLFCFWNTIFHKPGSSYARLSDNIQGVFCGDSFIGILSTNTSGESQYTLELYNKRGKSAGSVNFTMQYTDIDVAGDKVYIHNEQECQIFTIGGHCLFNGKFDKPIHALIPGAGLSDLLVVTDGEVDSVRLH